MYVCRIGAGDTGEVYRVMSPNYCDTIWDVAASVRQEMKSFSSNETRRCIFCSDVVESSKSEYNSKSLTSEFEFEFEFESTDFQ